MTGVKVEALPQSINGTRTETSSHQNGSKLIAVPAYPPYQSPPHLPRPPFIDVDGIANFRDVGGYACSPHGQPKTHMVRRGLIYRCALPNLVTPQGMTTATEDLKITAVYDLRSTPEIKRTAVAAPNPHDNTLASIRHFSPVYAEEDYGPDALACKLKWYSSPTDNPDFVALTSSTTTTTPSDPLPPYSLGFVNAYRDISIHGATAYRTIFTHILHSPTSPLVFHCTAGKDRTGVLAALILRLAGVDDDTICWEYALTEPGLGSWRDVFMRRMAQNSAANSPSPSSPPSAHTATTNGTVPIGSQVAEKKPVSSFEDSSITPAEAARICGARSPNMRAYLRLILDGEFGGVESYMTGKLGFTLSEVEQIRANLLVPIGEVGERGVTAVTEIPGWTPEGGVTEEFERVAKTRKGLQGVLGVDEGLGRER